MQEVLRIHEAVLRHGGSPGIRDRGALEAAIFRPQCGYYADEIEEAAALLESLASNHPFVDGNKRTALIAAELFLNGCGWTIRVSESAGEAFFLGNMEKGRFRFPVIRDWLVSVVKQLPK